MPETRHSPHSVKRKTGSTVPIPIEAERAILGTCFLDPIQFSRCADTLTGDHFAGQYHADIWTALLRSHASYGTTDALTVAYTLGEDLNRAGGISYLASLGDLATTNVSYYIDIMIDAYRRRRIASRTRDLFRSACDENANQTFLHLEQIAQEEALLAPAQKKGMSDVIKSTFAQIEKSYFGHSGSVPLGIDTVDEHVIVSPPDLVVLAARPSVGKSAIANQWLRHLCEGGNRCMVTQLEMTAEQMTMRWLSSLTGISTQSMRTKGALNAERDIPRLTHAAKQLSQWDVEIDDRAGQSIGEMIATARQLHRQSPFSAWFVDYLQLVSAPHIEHREQEIAYVSRSLKEAAKALNIPVIVLAQLNRGVEARKNKSNPDPMPTMADLRESGQIEQDADTILFLHDSAEQGLCLIVGKQRMGEKGQIIPLNFNKTAQTFS